MDRARPLRDPRLVCAALAVAVRALAAWQSWTENPARRAPILDAEVYLAWARDIAGGDVLGRHGVVAGGPFLLNPLYAYVVAPIVAVGGQIGVVVFQTLVAGATAWLAASAARRFAETPAAAWTAGAAVAFSTSLVHLDGHVAVSGLAAFLVAATCRACAPTDDAERARGPLLAGLLLGLSALARPVVVFALPAAMTLFALRRKERRVVGAALVLLPFLACAGLSFARNVVVAGESVVFTAANGVNLHVGNNPAARRVRQMFTDDVRFSPREMHEDAKYLVAHELGREPTRVEISDWFAGKAWDEYRDRPGESLAWTGEKLRWFFSPEEPSSSADLHDDRHFAPLLWLAFVPTGLLASAAVAGLACARRRGLLLGPGALVAAHAVACALAFPLEHYRSPAVPAMAVLVGCGAAAAWRRRRVVVYVAMTVVVALVGALPPQPAPLKFNGLVGQAAGAFGAKDYAASERLAREALDLEPDLPLALEVIGNGLAAQGRIDDARPFLERLAARRPWHPLYRKNLAWLDAAAGRGGAALAAMDALVAEFPWSAEVRAWRGEVRCHEKDFAGAKEDLAWAVAHGAAPQEWALTECGAR